MNNDFRRKRKNAWYTLLCTMSSYVKDKSEDPSDTTTTFMKSNSFFRRLRNLRVNLSRQYLLNEIIQKVS